MTNSQVDIARIVAAVERSPDNVLLLLVGFDGVLVDYEGDPQSVRLPWERGGLLSVLTDCPDVALGIVSGRRVSDLRQRAAVGDKAFYVGLHGLEVKGPDFGPTEHPVLETYRGRVHEIAAALESSMSSVAGVRIEDKDAVIAVHTREASSREAVWIVLHLLTVAGPLVNSQQLRVLRGNHVIELMPNIPNPRANAIAAIRRYVEERERKAVIPLYIGEDVPDDDAFAAMMGRGMSVAVGGRARKAQFHLASTVEVWQLIERITVGRITHDGH